MFCPKCGGEQVDNPTFCRSCGGRLSTPQTRNVKVCMKCGGEYDSAVGFCPSCGKDKTSWAWWLLPLFFTWVGGLVGWGVLKDRDGGKAKGLLILGCVMIPIWFVINVVIYIVIVIVAFSSDNYYGY